MSSVAEKVGGEHEGEGIPVPRIAAASAVGTVIEAYDFVLYGTVAALVFDELFFPNADPLIGTLAAFATFGVGFVARPFGGALFGHFGDRVGRKSMLIITLLTMGIATVLIGCLPGYDSIGIFAPILLVTLRLVQGLALGGEWGGAVLMVTEHAPKGKRGFYGSWPQIGFAGGLFLSTGLIALLTAVMSEAAFNSWGWRLPFMFSAVLVVVGLWVRLKIEETPSFSRLQEQQAEAKLPAVEVFQKHRKDVLRGIGLRFSENLTFYMLITFSLSYGEDELGISRGTLLAAIMIGAAGSFVAVPFFGALSDRVGRRPVYLWGAVASVALAIAFFPLLHTASPIIIVLAFILTFNTAHDAQYGPQAAYFSELFSTRVRYSGISISAQLGGVFAGAFAPLIATALLAAGGITWVAIYFAAGCLVTVVAAYLTPETYHRSLDDDAPATATGRFTREHSRETVGSA
jgi:MFS transporter, MHS family, shikimate and dehydroshikimate transport protein